MNLKTTRPGRRRARKGEGDLLREEILDAAEQLLVEKGHPDAVSMRAIAGRIGVSPPAIYLHFDDKDELFFHSCIRRFALLEAELGAVFSTDDRPVIERLEALARAYMRFGLDRAEQYAVMMAGPIPESISSGEMRELPGGRALSAVGELLAAGVEAGELRADVDPEAAASALWAACHGTVMVLIEKRKNPMLPVPAEDAVVEQTVKLIVAGMRA